MKTPINTALFFLALLATACGGDSTTSPSASSTRVSAAVSSATPAPPTATATAEPPTATPLPPEPTATEPPAVVQPAATQAPAALPLSPTQPPAAIPPTPVPPPPPPAGPVSLSVTARLLQFNTSQLTARSGSSVTVNFRNEDASVAHDVSFSIAGVGHGHTCFGPCSDTYTFTAPAPGTYPFFCTVHIDMTGNFVVTP